MKRAKITTFRPNGKGNKGFRTGYSFNAKLKDKDEILNWFRVNGKVEQENPVTGYLHGPDFNINVSEKVYGYIGPSLMIKFFMHFRFKGV